MTVNQEWDINTISPSQWSKLVGEAAHDKGNKHLYWDSSRNFKYLTVPSSQTDFHLMSVTELWDCSQKIFTQNNTDRQENKASGRDLLRNFKMLLSAEDDRIKMLSSSVFPEAHGKEIEGIKANLNLIETCLDLSSEKNTAIFKQAVQRNDETFIKNWLMLGGDLNKFLHSGETPLLYVISIQKPEIVKLLLNGSNVFIKDMDGRLSAFDYLLIDSLRESSTDIEPLLLSIFRDKFLQVPAAEKPLMLKNINQALGIAFFRQGKEMLGDAKFISKCLAIVDTLGAVGVNINTITKDGLSLLAFSIRDGNRMLAEKLIKLGADHRPALKQLGFSKLIYSAWRGDVDAIKKILSPRTKYLLGNAKDKEGNTALIWAVRMGHIDAVRQLVKEGVDLNSKNKEGHRALHYAEKNAALHTMLLEVGAKDDIGLTYLMKALLDSKSDINFDSLSPDFVNARTDEGFTALHYAVLRGMVDEVEQLLKRGANVNAINKYGITPLFYAARDDKFDIVKLLMRAGADLNTKNKNSGNRAYDRVEGEMKKLLEEAGAKDKRGHNALMRAAANGNQQIVEELIKKGFDLDAQSDFGHTALTLAIWTHNHKIVEILLEAKANVKIGPKSMDALDSMVRQLDGNPDNIKLAELLISKGLKLESTSELLFAIWKGDVETAAKLIKSRDIYLDAQDIEGQTAIHFAIRAKQPKIVKLLIAAHADVNLGNPLRMAIEKQDLCVELLLQANANVNVISPDQDTNLHLAIRTSSNKIVEKLIKNNAALDAQDSQGKTALHLAAENGYNIIFEQLILAKANLNLRDKEGNTALHLAIDWPGTDFVEQLILAKANPDIKDKNGNTPLMLSILKNRKDVALLLLKAKADPNIKSNNGETALYFALRRSWKDFIDIFIDCGYDLDAVDNLEMRIVQHLDDQIEKFKLRILAGEENSEVLKSRILIYEDLIPKLLSVGARDKKDRTPLMRATLLKEEKETYAYLEEYLSKKKGDINAVDYVGMTAAILVVRKGFVNSLKLLIQAGADLFIQDDHGHTALHYALTLGDLGDSSGNFRQFRKDMVVFFLGSSLAERLYQLFPIKLLPELYKVCKPGSAEKIVKELFPKLTSTEKSEALLLPFLLRDRKMAKIMMKALTPEERLYGLDFLAKNYPKANMDWIIESEIEFHPSHFKIVEEVIPPAPKGVNLDSLLHMFDQINTVDPDPRKPGYLHPKRLKNDTAPMTLVEIRASLELMVTRVKNKTEAFTATPPAGSVALVEFYTKVENALAHIIVKLSDPSIDPDVKTSALVDLAITGIYCGARYKTEPAYWYKRLTRGIETFTIEQEIGKILQDTRVGVVEKMVRKTRFPNETTVPIPNRPHTYNQIVRTIGPEFGIAGVSETFEDPDFRLDFLTKELQQERFLRDYSPTIIIDRIDAAINGVVEQGKMVPGSREIEPIVVDSWLKDHIKESALSTSVEIDGVERTLDYPTFIQMVNKAFEEEKKRLSALSDEEIVKDGNTKIKEFLLGKYGLKFGDEVNLQNWKQVKESIQLQSRKLKGGSRLERPDTLAEVEVYINKLTGRQNYTDFVLSALLSKKFGIAGVSNPQNWESVKQVLENRFRQEYVDTQIRKNGLIPRNKIVTMLLDMQVLDVA